MAKKQDASSTDVVKAESSELAEVPEFLKVDAGQGLEHIGRNDVLMPRLALAQGLSPQINPDNPVYVDGLKLGDAWNTLTQQIYGRGPWHVAIVRADETRWVEFFPREAGGGVKDPDVKFGDSRTLFTTGEDGKRVPPIATEFRDFVVVFLDTKETVALSFKSTGIKVAKQLNSLLLLRKQLRPQLPLYVGKFTLRSVMTQNTKGNYATLQIANSGDVTDIETLKFLQTSFQALKDKNLVIEREPGQDDDEPELQ